MLSNRLGYLLQRYFPHFIYGSCLLCQAKTTISIDLCHACKEELPYLKNACFSCAAPLTDNKKEYCDACSRQNLLNNYRIFSPFMYQFPIDQLIIDLKFKYRLSAAKVLAELMIEKMQVVYQDRKWPDLIIPVPLHTSRLKQRGFNQAVELAKPIASFFKIPLDYGICSRVNYTQPQTNLSAKDRAINLQNAFDISKNICADHVCLLDDVVTTGSTTFALGKRLLEAGVQSIDVWCCARARLPNSLH